MDDVEQRSAEADVGPSAPAGAPPARGGDGPPSIESGARVCEVSLEEFEGPLDLLLHLVRRHELDILDIPISFVCEKYLEYIEFMQALELEVAGDYLVMAATLAYLKSRELLPQGDALVEDGGEEEGGTDPREQLIARLLEYQKYKEAADRLDARPIAGRDTFGRGAVVELPPVDAGLAPITLFRLAEAYQRVLERARIHKSHEVVMETISVAARMEQLTGLLIERSRFEFEALFLERPWTSESELRGMLVVTLMSILELVRMGVASVHQPLGSDTIVVERVASAEDAREALRGYDESLSFGDGRTQAEASDEEGFEDEALAGDEDDALADAALVGDEDDALADEALVGDEDDALADEALVGDALADEALAARDAVEDLEPSADALLDDEGMASSRGQRGARVTEQASPEGEAPEAAAPSGAEGGLGSSDAGVFGRSVVSESPALDAPLEGVGVAAPVPSVEDGASRSTEGDGQEHGENGEAEAVEGS